MDKDKFLDIMIESFHQDTRLIMKQLGWEDSLIDQKVEENMQSLSFMLANGYDKLQENNLVP